MNCDQLSKEKNEPTINSKWNIFAYLGTDYFNLSNGISNKNKKLVKIFSIIPSYLSTFN